MKTCPRIVLTPGEPAGIGPDITLMMACRSLPAEIIAITDRHLLAERARMLGLEITLHDYEPGRQTGPHRPGDLPVIDVPLARPIEPGHADSANGPVLLQTLDRAIRGCLDGEFAALVTGPVNKAIINASGTPFTGHTEYLADRTATPQVVMMLTAPGLRVALVTTHLPLRAVPDAVTPNWLENTLRITHAGLQRHYAIAYPRLLVCGLNPHAGEAGHLGHEDRDVIAPVIARLQAEGLDVRGPLPADTVFTPRHMAQADVIVAIYHDQGLPVLKHRGFGQAVNVTLGLPFIRTSVDHGTAFELAGTGRADAGSLLAACNEALAMIAANEAATTQA